MTEDEVYPTRVTLFVKKRAEIEVVFVKRDLALIRNRNRVEALQ
jgi:hypothetical protein